MTSRQLVLRGLTYYWRTNAAVVLGVATAVAVLAGALLVGDSVRRSLRDLVLERLGRTDSIVVSSGFFREALADDLRTDVTFAGSFTSICPIIAVPGLVTDQASGRRASRVQVYGVDDRFWRFHGLNGGAASGRALGQSDGLVGRALAAEIGTRGGNDIVVRVERPSAIPIESLHGRKEDLGETLRLTVRAIVGPEGLGEFSLRPQQAPVLALFVPLGRLQQELKVGGRVNTLLVSERRTGSADAAGLEALVRRRIALDDLGLTVRTVEPVQAIALESAGGLLDEARAAAADRAADDVGMQSRPVLTYLVNSMRSGDREIPYSLVTALDLASIADAGPPDGGLRTKPPIVLNEWAARDLHVAPGDPLMLEYYVWEEPGRLATGTAAFQVAAIVPIEGAAADRNLAPAYPGITDSDRLGDWDPPFPIDLRRVRPLDEEYWRKYRTTPKAFIPLEVGQSLWRTRYGARTSVRIVPGPATSLTQARDRYAAALRASIDPLASGVSVQDVRTSGLAASRGATDFGEYFAYFSVFLVLSALLLAALFFRLGVEQRAREVGLLRAVGYPTAAVRRLFLFEAFVLAALGSLVGVAGAVGYAAAMMVGLRTWWSGAVGTTMLALHVSPRPLVAGAGGTLVAAMACVWWTLVGLSRLSERSLLVGRLAGDEPAARSSTAEIGEHAGGRFTHRVSRALRLTVLSRSPLAGAIGCGLLGAALVAASLAGAIDPTGAFFGAGTSLVVACLCLVAFGLRRPVRRPLAGHGLWPVSRLGLRNAAARPGRSVLTIGVIASATFVLISVNTFRRETPATTDPHSGGGGYSVLVETLLPIVHEPGSAEGRDLLGLTGIDDARVEAFHLLPGDDASCLNLYEPQRPRILGASRQFIASGRFAFASSLAMSEAERTNPWLILDRDAGEDVVPVVADANSMTYVLHKKLGDDIVIRTEGRPVRLRLMAALDDSVFQGELVMSDASFQKLFPGQAGYRFLLVETPPARAAEVAAAVEKGGADLGADAVSTMERLAAFHQVENTYLSTFQMLGALGLLVGTVGLSAVVLRNVLERRRELALLGAVGYRRRHVFMIVLAENVLLLGWGLAVGTACALVATVPAFVERGGTVPAIARAGLLLVAVSAAGLLSSMVATRAALRTPLLGALRAE